MNSKLLFTAITCYFLTAHNQQPAFKPGWYIVEKGAEYGVYANGYIDYNDKGKAYNVSDLTIQSGEVVYVWEQSKNLFIANEWFGRISFFKSLSKLTPVPEAGKVGYLLKDVENLSGTVATEGSAVWITEFNTANKTVTILLNDNNKVSIPASDIQILATFLESSSSSVFYKLSN